MNPIVFRNISYGLYVVGTQDAANKRPTGCIVNSVMQITSQPATIAVSVNHDNYTNSCIRESGMFSVSILSEECEPSIIGNFGFKTGREIDKFATVPYELKQNMPVLKTCCGYLVCKLIKSMEAPTHTVFLGEVVDGDTMLDEPPMTYAYYHKVFKGKSPKNAPTYIAEERNAEKKPAEEKPIWRCTLCGYEYDGEVPFEQLPDDYVCPLCGATKDMFEKVEPVAVPAPKAAEPKAEKKYIWRCTLCGYEYDGEIPFEQLPDDYICPLCGATKDMFEKVESVAAPAPKAAEPKTEKKYIWRCTLCGYEYDGEIPFEQLPDDYVCPLCGATKDMFERVEA